jgi:hypothetical protein
MVERCGPAGWALRSVPILLAQVLRGGSPLTTEQHNAIVGLILGGASVERRLPYGTKWKFSPVLFWAIRALRILLSIFPIYARELFCGAAPRVSTRKDGCRVAPLALDHGRALPGGGGGVGGGGGPPRGGAPPAPSTHERNCVCASYGALAIHT